MMLVHPKLGECGTEVITKDNPEWKIEQMWRRRYGQILKQCHIKIVSDKEEVIYDKDLTATPTEKPIKNIQTGDIYYSRDEAKMETGLSESCVFRHLYRKNKPGFKYILKFA